MEYGLREKVGFVLLTGEIGAGKTKVLGVNRSTVSRNKAIDEISGPVALMVDKANHSA
jgi:hypothetical protein